MEHAWVATYVSAIDEGSEREGPVPVIDIVHASSKAEARSKVEAAMPARLAAAMQKPRTDVVWYVVRLDVLQVIP
jgi:hypothetical protein